jgi:hypothetical protein
MGYDSDLIDTLAPEGAADFNMETIERFKDEDAYPYRSDNYVDPSMHEVWLHECYLRIDYDGDGIAELRKITMAGESSYVLLDNEEVDDHPFCTLTPVPMPHKLIGMSIADQTTDLQRIKTALWRGALDAIYYGVAPVTQVVEGQVNLDDLLNRRPGSVVRTRSLDAMQAMETAPLKPEVFQAIEYVDTVREARTGVRRFNSTLDPDQVNDLSKTATAATLADNAANDRLGLIARIFAETGIKRAMRRMLELVCKHQEEPQVIRLRGKYVPIDPREWTTEMDLSISVGLGTGDRGQQLGHLMALAPIYDKIIAAQQGIQGPLVTAENIYNFGVKLVEFASLRSPELYFTDPKTAPPQPPKPDPKMVEAQGKVQAQQMQAQASIQADQTRAQYEMQRDTHKAQLEMAMEQMREQFNAQLESQKAQHAMALEEMRAQHKARLDETEIALRARAGAYTPGPAPGGEARA